MSVRFGDALKLPFLSADPVVNEAAGVLQLYPKSDGLHRKVAGDVRRVLPYVDVRDFCVGDGVTDDWDNFKLAVDAAAGGLLYVAPGVYFLNVQPGTRKNIPQGTTIAGAGFASQLLVGATGGGAGAGLFRFDASFTMLRDLLINLAVDAGTASSLINVESVENRFLNLDIAGGHTDTHQHTVHCFRFGSLGTSAERTSIVNCTIQRMRFGLLKGNADTGTTRDVRVHGCNFRFNYGNDLAFNSPNGPLVNVTVSACLFQDNQGAKVGTYAIMCGMASATNVKVVGNHFEGTGREAVHIEEGSYHVTVANNTIAMSDDDGCGIVALDNNVGGAALSPEYVTITGNTIRGGNATGTGYGIRLTNDGAEPPMRYASIGNNTIDLFGIGIQAVHDDLNSVLVADNVIRSCNLGIDSIRPQETIRHNQLIACTNAFNCTAGGMFGAHRFDNVTAYAAVAGGVASIAGWTIDRDVDLPASTATDQFIFPLGTEAHGTLRIHWHHGNFAYRVAFFDVNWDGATLIATERLANGVGTTTLVDVRNFGGLAVRLNVTGAAAQNNGRLQAVFDGLWIF